MGEDMFIDVSNLQDVFFSQDYLLSFIRVKLFWKIQVLLLRLQEIFLNFYSFMAAFTECQTKELYLWDTEWLLTLLSFAALYVWYLIIIISHSGPKGNSAGSQRESRQYWRHGTPPVFMCS